MVCRGRQIVAPTVIETMCHQMTLFICHQIRVCVDQVVTLAGCKRAHAHTRTVTCRSGWRSLEHLAVSASAGCWLTGDDLMKHSNCETLPCSCLCCSPASAIGSTENRGAAVGPMDKKHQYGSLERTEWSRDTHKAGYLVNNCWFIITFR